MFSPAVSLSVPAGFFRSIGFFNTSDVILALTTYEHSISVAGYSLRQMNFNQAGEKK